MTYCHTANHYIGNLRGRSLAALDVHDQEPSNNTDRRREGRLDYGYLTIIYGIGHEPYLAGVMTTKTEDTHLAGPQNCGKNTWCLKTLKLPC